MRPFKQGYVYTREHGNPGEEGFGTTVWFDTNGANYGGYQLELVDLAGVHANQLNWTNSRSSALTLLTRTVAAPFPCGIDAVVYPSSIRP